jgi:hypothetical protein
MSSTGLLIVLVAIWVIVNTVNGNLVGVVQGNKKISVILPTPSSGSGSNQSSGGGAPGRKTL